jgi:hypothetical protein
MKTLPLFLFVILLSLNLTGQTYFQGGIYNSTEWTVQNSPYIITGDVVVFPDKTLTIQPGVEIRFNGYYFLEIRGTLVSVGTEANPIIYTSNQASPAIGDWYRVMIKNDQGAKASFEYSEFSYASTATEVECCWNGGPIYFKNCKFDYNQYAMKGYTGYVIEVDNCEFYHNTIGVAQADKNITNSTFIGNGYGLYYTERINVSNSLFTENQVALDGCRGLVDGCTINNNGIAVKSIFDGFKLINNTIEDNDTGILLSTYDGGYLPIKNNRICNIFLNVINTDDINKDLTGNCWCVRDSTQVEDKLIDGYDNIYLGLFNYDIYDENCFSKIMTVIKVDLLGVDDALTANPLVNLYPNPFQSNLALEFKSLQAKPMFISIYSMDGRLVHSGTYSGNPVSLSLDQLESGIYSCVIQTGTTILNKKIIKL